MNGRWSTSGVALNSRLLTWLLTTSVEDFRACIHSKRERFEHNLWTDNINFVSICHFQCNVCMTVAVFIFHSKSVPATSTVRPTRVFVLQGSAAAKSGYGGRFYSVLRRRYFLSDTSNKLLKSDSNCQSYIKCYRGTLFDLQFHVHDVLSAFTR